MIKLMNEKYEKIKAEILRLCDLFDIPRPSIKREHWNDTCDITNPPFIRIKVVDDISVEHHARHVLGHYISDLHLIDADYVADLFASIIRGK